MFKNWLYRIGSGNFGEISEAWMRAAATGMWSLIEGLLIARFAENPHVPEKFPFSLARNIVLLKWVVAGKRRQRGNSSRETAPVRWHKKSGSQVMWRIKWQS